MKENTKYLFKVFLITIFVMVSAVLYGCVQHQHAPSQVVSEQVQLRQIGTSDSNRRNFFTLNSKIANLFIGYRKGIIRTNITLIQMVAQIGRHYKFIELPLDYVDFEIDSSIESPSVSCTYFLGNGQPFNIDDENDFDALFKPSFALRYKNIDPNNYELAKITTSGICYVKYSIRCRPEDLPKSMSSTDIREENLQYGEVFN